MFTLTYVELEYETNIFIWEFEMLIVVLPSFGLPTQVNLQNTKETEFINELWNINLYMNIGIFNWHNWSFDYTYLNFLTLFQFLLWLLTSNHPKLFSTYLTGRNGVMFATCFSAPQNAKKKICLNIKTTCLTDSQLTVRSTSMKHYACYYGVSP
jgi:hypothetical protein